MHTHKIYQGLTGDIDGENKTFTLPSTPKTGSVRLFVRGLEQFVGVDFTVTGGVVVFAIAPLEDDTLYSHYEEET